MGKLKNAIDWETLEGATDDDLSIAEMAAYFELPPFDGPSTDNRPQWLKRHLHKQSDSDIGALDDQGWD